MKLMDKIDGDTVKNLFRTQRGPEEADPVIIPRDLPPVDHTRREGETYNQYGVRVAGLSEGNPHALTPCLQSVFYGIRREQEDDVALQEELRNKLRVKRAELEAERQNKENAMKQSKERQESLSAEIEEYKEELSVLKHGVKERNRNAWITLVISSILLVPFTIYFFIFYSSVGYSAFFKEFGVGNLENGDFSLSQAIFDSQAISNACEDGFAELTFILFMPVIFLAFGFVLNRWEREKGFLKYIKIPALIAVAFIFDSLLSYEICEKIYNLNAEMQLGEVPPYSMSLAFTDARFWIIICLGFVSYLVWGFVYGFWIKAWEELDLNPEKRKRIEDKIDACKKKLEEERKNHALLQEESTKIEPQIKEIEVQMTESARYDMAKIKLELNHFFTGWQTYLAVIKKTDEEKQEATFIFNQMIERISVTH